MRQTISRQQVKKLIGQQVYAIKKDGARVSGKLVRIKGDRLYLQSSKGKSVRTKAILPLVLFDLLAIGTSPFGFGFGGPGYGYGGYGYGGFGGGFGYPGFF